jgi:hypothetical protein
VADHPAFASTAVCRPSGAGAETQWFRRMLFPIGAAALLSLAACANQSAISVQGKRVSGYVRMTQVQAAYLGSGNAGSGVLFYQGDEPMNLNIRIFALALPILLASCASYGPYHPNTSAEPLNSVRGPTDGRYKLAFIEFGDQGSALDTSHAKHQPMGRGSGV